MASKSNLERLLLASRDKLIGVVLFLIGIILATISSNWSGPLANLMAQLGALVATSVAIGFIYSRYTQRYERAIFLRELREEIRGAVLSTPPVSEEKSYALDELIVGYERPYPDLDNDPRIYYCDNDKARSKTLIVLLHGLGLDHRDFEKYIASSEYHCVAPSLYSFHPRNLPTGPLEFAEHCHTIKAFIEKIRTSLKPSEILLVGFSTGADIALQLVAEYFSQAELNRSNIVGLLTLDCNLNNRTCFFSREIAKLEPEEVSKRNNVEIVKTISDAAFEKMRGTMTLDGYLDLQIYLGKVFGKFLGRRTEIPINFARVIYETYGIDDYSSFLRFASATVGKIPLRCVFSGNTESLLDLKSQCNTELRVEDIDQMIKTDSVGHFDLIREDRMKGYIESFFAQIRGVRDAT